MTRNKVIISGIVLLSLFVICLFNAHFTGYAVSEGDAVVNNSIVVGARDAQNAITQSETIIENLKKNGFSVSYVNDLLLEAKNTLKLVDYAEILRNSNDYLLRAEASEALKFTDWKNLDYSNVLIVTDKIKEAETKVFLVYDSLSALNLKINNEKNRGIDTSSVETIAENAQTSFNAERYDESLKLIEDAKLELENKKAENASIRVLSLSVIDFVLIYWYYFIIGILVLIILIKFSSKKIRKYLLIKKIAHLNAEQQVLMTLMVRTQKERYKENKISGLVYNIRMEKYQQRVNEIKETIPVLQDRLTGKKRRKYNNFK